MTVIAAHTLNHGNHVMARTSDISFNVPKTIYEQYIRLVSLVMTNDFITDIREARSIFLTIHLIRRPFMVPLTGRSLVLSNRQ